MDEIKLKIKVFKASDDMETCAKYVEGHMDVLRVFGITMITTANTEWFDDPNTYVITVQSADGEIIYAGARIQIAGGKYPLPIEKAVSKFDPNIHTFITDRLENGIGELCGLWNSREIVNFGIGSLYLGRIGTAISSHLKLKTLFALCAPITVRNCIKMGYLLETSLGNNGTFYYPKEDLIATVVTLADTSSFTTANEKERNLILDLRNNPIQNRFETGPRGQSVNIDLNLNISAI